MVSTRMKASKVLVKTTTTTLRNYKKCHFNQQKNHPSHHHWQSFLNPNKHCNLVPFSFSSRIAAALSSANIFHLQNSKSLPYSSSSWIYYLLTMVVASPILLAVDRNDESNSTLCEEEEEEYDEIEERSCPFCKFFLDSPCKDSFIEWQKCVKKADKATDCMEPFDPLKKCMDANEITFDTSDDDDDDDDAKD